MDRAPTSRRGTETRQKQRRITFRLTEAELAQIDAAAERDGVTVGTYIRSRVLTEPTTRARRKPAVEVVALARLQGEMNKIGSNIHQLVKRVNFGETPAGEEVVAAFDGYRDVIAAILATLGRVPR